MNARWFSLIALAALAVLAAIGGTRAMSDNATDDLIERTRAGLIFVEGGNFDAGNYQTEFVEADGSVATRWAYEPSMTREPHEVTLASFYMQDRELSYADFNLFLRAQGEPETEPDPEYGAYLPDRAAAISWQEAEAYCAWLGELTGLAMRLPTEVEWEYAARSRGNAAPWATDDGSYREGDNVRHFDAGRPEVLNPAIASFAPNPLGMFDMAGGLYEWVSDLAPDDPQEARIYKGGSDFGSILREVIPTRGVAMPLPEVGISQLPADEAERYLRRGEGPIHIAGATLRCVVADSHPPSDSGFGRAPDPAPVDLRGPFGFTER